MTDKVGQQLGNYHLVRLLCTKTFADVYLGQHVHIQNMQAVVKILKVNLPQNYQTLFFQEAESIARLEHPHIISILEFGIDSRDYFPYLVMDYAPRGTLRSCYPQRSIVPHSTVVTYVKQIAEALQYTHDHHLVHRNLKPENLLIGDNGKIMISDFGLASIAQSTATSSMETSAYSSTLPYTALEQKQGSPCTVSDQYSLGIIVYEWFTGERPFIGTTLQEITSQQTGAFPRPLSEKRPDIPRNVEEAVMKSLARDPRYRFPTIHMFATDLEHAFSMEKPQSQRGSFSSFIPRNQQSLRKFLLLAVAILLVVACTVASVGATIHSNQMNSVATATARAQATTSAQTDATTTAEAQTEATATAQAQANPYGGSGTLALNDPLGNDSQGNGWPEGSDSVGSCTFTEGAYHASNTSPGTSNNAQACEAAADFSNFTFEVQMTIIKGDSGGIVFRDDSQRHTYYIFYINQNGSYDIIAGDRGTNTSRVIGQPTANSAIHSGTGQTNIIAVVAQDSMITLYVNHQRLTRVSDSTNSHGQTGVMASELATGGQPTEVAYSNAKVWTF